MTLKSELDIFGQLFKRRLNDSQRATLRWVSATNVDWEAQTMIAVDGDGLEFIDVLLGVGTTAVKPVVGTDCLIAIVEGDEAISFLLFADDVEEIYFKSGQTQLAVSPDGCLIERSGQNLLTVLTDLVAELQKVVVVVGTSPNVAALQSIKNRLTQVLRE